MNIIILKLDNSLQNFNYLVYCNKTRECLVIDPLDSQQILSTAQFHDLKITTIVNTHEHGDHTQGNAAVKMATNATIMAHHDAAAIIPGFDKGLHAGDRLNIGQTVSFEILDTPGHTMHHICLYNDASPAIFTGDTLFNCGCGNCYNGGSPDVMFETFETQLSKLPDNTRIYPGHDYIRNNLRFAEHLQPNLAAISVLKSTLNDHEEDVFISTLAEDKTVDPFFRLDDADLIKRLQSEHGLGKSPSRRDVFLKLRELRDGW